MKRKLNLNIKQHQRTTGSWTKNANFLLHCLSVCISRNFWWASLLLVYGLFLNRNQRWLRPGGIWVLDIKSNEEDVNQKSNFHSEVCSQTWSLLLLLSFSHFSPMHLQSGAVQLCAENFFFLPVSKLLPPVVQNCGAGRNIQNSLLNVQPHLCAFFLGIFWHLTLLSTFRDSGWCSILQLSRQMAF